MSSYAETLQYLWGLEVTRGWDLTLERMRAALAMVGHPEASFPAIHIAGTNGKGSTAAMIAAVLTRAGYRTGLYTSPHLVDFAERIRVNGGTIPHAAVVARVASLRTQLAAADLALTHFEFVTLLAFGWFAEVGVEVAVVEVGLGGRLDATNVVRPVVTAITSIARDHEEYLGTELAAIACEKAGILKPGVPVALGPVPAEAEAAIVSEATRVGAAVVRCGRDTTLDGDSALEFHGPGAVCWRGLRLGLPGRFQRHNAEVALTTLALVQARFPCAESAVRAGLQEVQWPGRLALVGDAPRVVLDGAHNPAGVLALAAELPALVGQRRLVLVFGVMADKRWEPMLAELAPRAAHAILTRVGRRGLGPEVMAAATPGGPRVEIVSDPRPAVRRALVLAGPDGAVVVAGSLLLVGEAYIALAKPNSAPMLFEPWQP